MFQRMRISTRLWLMAGVPIVLISLVGVTSFVVLQQIKINGDRYDEIVSAKDLVADVLPPPEYIVETHLTVHQLAAGGDQDVLTDRLRTLEQEFTTRHEFWVGELEAPDARQAMLVDAYDPAVEYFRLVEQEFLPALEGGDSTTAGAVLAGPMESAYADHRAGVDRVVEIATAQQVAAEAAAADDERAATATLGIALLVLLGVTGLLGATTVTSIVRRVDRLRRTATDDLPRIIADVKRSTEDGAAAVEVPTVDLGTDELAEAAQAFNTVVATAVSLAGEQARLRRTTSEMFVNLGRRNHKLLNRSLSQITTLEQDERDPARLGQLFRLDHMVTRMRRNAESLLVIAGSAPMRTWSTPVGLQDVLRSSLSEIEGYERVDVRRLDPVAVRGGAVADLSHLLAELLENAASFSPPETRVTVLGRAEASGYCVTVVDEGIGMAGPEMALAQRRVSSAQHGELDDSKMLGLGVVGRLAARHGITVDYTDSPIGGVAVRIWVPAEVLAEVPAAVPAEVPTAARPGPEPAPVVDVASPVLPVLPVPPVPPVLPVPVPAQRDELAAAAAPEAAGREVESAGAESAGAESAGAGSAITDGLSTDGLSTDGLSTDDLDPDDAAGGTGTTRLRRRVRGAQLPDTGPAVEVAAPARSADQVRSALASFSSGRAAAAATRTDDSGSTS